MTLRELYRANYRWGKETELCLNMLNGMIIDIKAGEAVKQYGDYHVCVFLNDVVEIVKERKKDM